MTEPFDDSRRLTGSNAYFAESGAVLETVGIDVDADLVERWRSRILVAREWLGWPAGPIHTRIHASGATLAFAAPLDQLLVATEVNEWALLSTLDDPDLRGDIPLAPGHAACWDDDFAQRTLRASAADEADPKLAKLIAAALARKLPALPGEDLLTLGAGSGARSWPLDTLPDVDDVPWSELHAIPLALVTGSNGKTTSVRLLAAMAKEDGRSVAHSCTDGLFVDGVAIESGDFSGPVGARTVLRQPGVETAILETARGGLLRRGLAVARADVALISNVSADHYGEYGIHELADLAAAKLTVARAANPDGLLVLNADDALLRKLGPATTRGRIGWFSLDDNDDLLVSHREGGGSTCAMAAGHLWLSAEGVRHDLGEVAAMPLSVEGSARYNIANLAGAALAATALGISLAAIRAVLHRFGSDNDDNPGRLERWSLGGVSVWVDYAHNPDGMAGLLDVATARQGDGRLGLVLGQAGNRENKDIIDLARAAARYKPARVVLKDMLGYERGREPGEVANILRTALIEGGVAEAALAFHRDETDGVVDLLKWAQPGDVLVLPIHAIGARRVVREKLDRLRDRAWQPGQSL
ncbi:MAG: Mur ligase family protein [Dokdonella sp.]